MSKSDRSNGASADASAALIGLVAAPHTPFTASGALNLPVVKQQARWLADQGVVGAFICGTTGEGLSLTISERMQLAEEWMRCVDSRLRVIVHVGHASVSEAVALAQHAATLKPAAFSAMPPSFFKPGSIDSLVTVCGQIAAAAPNLPFYYYHIPSMTQVNLPMTALLAAVSGRISNFRGIKYTHNDVMEFRQCSIFEGGRYDILFGRDEMLLGALPYGARGAVGSTYNYATPLYLEIMGAFRAGDMAAAARRADDIAEMVDLIRDVGEIAAGKAFVTLSGVPVGGPRPPLVSLTATQMRRVERFYEKTLRGNRGHRSGGNGTPTNPALASA